jgi:hypothetical protein
MKYEHNNLIINGLKLTFMQPIIEVDKTKIGYLVMVDSEPGHNDRNIFLVGFDGAVKWQIERFNANYPPGEQAYLGAFIDQEGVLWANNRQSYTVRLDPETGKILEEIFTK